MIFWVKLEQGDGSRIRQKIRIDISRCFAAVSNRESQGMKDFTDFTTHSNAHGSADITSR